MPVFLRRRSVLLGSAAVAGAATLPASRLLAQAEAEAEAPAAPSTRRNHALLVAVTEYPNLFQSEWLRGPNNDALQARAYLLNDCPVPFAPEDIVMLGTKLDGAAAEPTLANIRGEMKRLAETVAEGDFVYLHFGGHGIEQPARFPEQEVDGRDQVFMPKDVERFTRELGHWPNGYVDKDIRDDITEIRRNGARVWAIFDCCHSATITRALELAPEGEVMRKIDLANYGIPDDMWAPAATRSLSGDAAMAQRSMFGAAGEVGLEEDLAPMVAFFAAQTVEPTPEMPLPRGSENAEQMGLFSFTILTKLRENPRVNYRQLGQAIHHAYLGMNRTRPTPLFEGALNEPVFDIGDGESFVPGWRITGMGARREIAAGHMHQLAPGTRLAVLAQPNHRLDQALGVVQVGSATALTSRLAPLSPDEDDPDLPAIALSDIPENAYALLLERVVEFELAVALPRADSPHAPQTEAITRTLEEIAANERMPIRIRLVAPNADADLRFDIRSEAEVADLMRSQGQIDADDGALLERAAASTAPRVWLLDNAAVLSLRAHQRPFSRAIDLENFRATQMWVRDSITAVYRATNLARLATFDDFGTAGDVAVQVTRLPELFSPLETGEALQLHRTGVVTPGNTVHIRVENSGTRPVDLNIIYIGSDYSITSMLPDPVRLRGVLPREPNAVFSEEVVEFNDLSFGRERLFVIVTEGQAQENPLDLSFLEQGGVRATVRGVPASGFGEMLETMAGAATTRGASSLVARRAAAEGQRGAVYVYSVDNVPAG